jgi:hypothetical protein
MSSKLVKSSVPDTLALYKADVILFLGARSRVQCCKCFLSLELR